MKEMNRRDFLKIGGTATAAAALAACVGKSNSELGDIDPLGHHTGEIPTDKMTYRTNPNTGDEVSILGYGMMRLPNKPMSNSARTADKPQEEEIDQEQVNRLVKFALDHGVNYFDTSPAYCRGHSEESTGIALKASGYDRSKYFIATKLSNFAPDRLYRLPAVAFGRWRRNGDLQSAFPQQRYARLPAGTTRARHHP